MNTLYIALAALLGGIVTALLGWLESGEPFNPRKFGGSVIRSLIAAAIFAAGYQVSGGCWDNRPPLRLPGRRWGGCNRQPHLRQAGQRQLSAN